MSTALRVMSFGAGVQTTALAILTARGEVERPGGNDATLEEVAS